MRIHRSDQRTFEEAQEIERHLHNRERWCGISADQSGDDWALPAGLTPYVCISGNADFGAACKVLGTADTPNITGMVKFDMHQLLVVELENDTPWVVRLIWDKTDAATGEAAGRYTDIMLATDFEGVPIPILMERLDVGADMVWAKVKNATNLDELDFFVGIHEYES